MKLDDLTKSELIALMRNSYLVLPTEREMAVVRWNRLQDMAANKRAESIELGKKRTLKSFWQSQELWDDSEKLTRRARKLYERYMGSVKDE